MAETALTNPERSPAHTAGWKGFAADWSSDQRAFKNVSWGKAMMWIFLLSDTFIFSCFLLSYMTTRMSTTVPWPNPSEVFALEIAGHHMPLILIAIMTFVLISSSGTMAMAVNFGYRRDRAGIRRNRLTRPARNPRSFATCSCSLGTETESGAADPSRGPDPELLESCLNRGGLVGPQWSRRHRPSD